MDRRFAKTWKAVWLIAITLMVATLACAREETSPNTGETGELELISNLNIAAGPENITDVWAHTAPSGKSYAYLGTYNNPSGAPGATGVHVVDITDPSRPVKASFITSPQESRISDVNVGHIETSFFRGDILVFSVEFLSRETPRSPSAIAGMVLYDVTDPLKPSRLARDFSLGFEAHNAFFHQREGRAFVMVVRDDSSQDFVIVDITNPASPVVASATGWKDWRGSTGQLALGAFPASFLHDIWARSYSANHPNPNYAGKTIAYLAHWDAGVVLLDITDPTKPIFLGDSDYVNPDPLTGMPPEGNAHSAVPTEDGSLVFMGDEDFTAFRTLFAVDSGAFAGQYPALEGSLAKRLSHLEGEQLTGQAIFVGRACAAADIPSPPRTTSPDVTFIAIIERDECPFDEKIANAAAAGYDGAILFNNAVTPGRLFSIRGRSEAGTIPVFSVSRFTAFAILGMSPDSPPETPLPSVGSLGQRVSFRAIFDGWGYGRILDVSDPKNIVELGQVSVPNVLARQLPTGDHSMHNVVVKGRRAYISWYADGIRVVDFSNAKRPYEVTSFVDNARGSNFWGVHLYEHPDGNTYILGSDRSTGLWLFKVRNETSGKPIP